MRFIKIYLTIFILPILISLNACINEATYNSEKATDTIETNDIKKKTLTIVKQNDWLSKLEKDKIVSEVSASYDSLAGICISLDITFEKDLSKEQWEVFFQKFNTLKFLYIRGGRKNIITELPEGISRLSNLESLVVSADLYKIDASLYKLKELKELYIYSNFNLNYLPNGISELTKLERLEIYNNSLALLPIDIGNLPNLKILNIGNNLITSIPTGIGKLSTLEELTIKRNPLTALPKEIENLSKLTKLEISNEYSDMPRNNEYQKVSSIKIKTFELTLEKMNGLLSLYITSIPLTALPTGINNLQKLKYIHINETKLDSLEKCLCTLPSVEKIEIYNSPIKYWNPCIFNINHSVVICIDENEDTTLLMELSKKNEKIFISTKCNE